MLAGILKVLGVVGITGAGIGGGFVFASSSSKKDFHWSPNVNNIGSILSCKEDDGGENYELFVNVGEGSHLEEKFDLKFYKVTGDKKELVKEQDISHFWLWYDNKGKFEKISIQKTSDLTSSGSDHYGKEIKCQAPKIETSKNNSGGGKVDLRTVSLRVKKETCMLKGGWKNQKSCDLELLSGEHLKWTGFLKPQVTYNLVAS